MPWIKDEDGRSILVAEDSPENKSDKERQQWEHESFMRAQEKSKQFHIKKNKMKKAKITSCVYSREWEGPSGKIYYHNITLDNGDEGSVGTKEKMPSKICTGAEVWYDIEAKGQFKGKTQYTIKLQKAPENQYQPSKSNAMSTTSNSSQQESIARSVALKAAIDAVGAGEQPAAYVNVALYFEHYLLTGKQANEDAVDNALNDRKMDANIKNSSIPSQVRDEYANDNSDLPF